MNAPILSVLLPVYNSARFLGQAIESVLGQTFSDFEFIIINDGSNDESAGIIEAYAIRDRRIRVFHQKNLGLVRTLNRGLELAQAPFVARMDADDIALPKRFALQLSKFTGRSQLALVGGFIITIDKENVCSDIWQYPLEGRSLALFMEERSPLAHPAVIMRRRVIQDLGGYREQYKHAEDYDLWLRVHDAGYEIENIPEVVLQYRRYEDSVTARNKSQQVLVANVARLAHRARLAGFPDPTSDLTSINRTTLTLFPETLRSDLEANLFVMEHRLISRENISSIRKALADYNTLSETVRREPIIAKFLTRVVRGLWANRCYGLAIKQLAYATVRDRSVTFNFLKRKMRRMIGQKAGPTVESHAAHSDFGNPGS